MTVKEVWPLYLLVTIRRHGQVCISPSEGGVAIVSVSLTKKVWPKCVPVPAKVKEVWLSACQSQ